MELQKIAELLNLHPSVIDNYHEEWQFQEKQIEGDHYTVTFKEYLCNVFAECAFLIEATKNCSNALACLEAYDEIYTTIESMLEA